MPEFPRNVIEALRQPLEEGEVHVARINQSVRYPARFTLVATMNPCPCGWLNSNQKECQCSPYQVAQYRKKVSGPILDRIDLYLTLAAVPLSDLHYPKTDRSQLANLRAVIKRSWDVQHQRNSGVLNAFIPSSQITRLCEIAPDAYALLESAAKKFVITGRSYHKILKVARTIADVNSRPNIASTDIAEALQYRFSATGALQS